MVLLYILFLTKVCFLIVTKNYYFSSLYVPLEHLRKTLHSISHEIWMINVFEVQGAKNFKKFISLANNLSELQ